MKTSFAKRVTKSIGSALATPISERVDSAIFAAFPGWGAKRRAIRQQTKIRDMWAEQQKERMAAWDSARKDTRTGSQWLTSRLSSDSELELDHSELRLRSREQFRNNPLIASFVNGFVENVIGSGMRPQSRIDPEATGLGDDAAEKLGDTVEGVYQCWSENAGSRGESFEEIQRLMVRCWAMDGEAIVVMSDVRDVAGKPVPLTLEVIDVERLETPPEKTADPSVRLGIEKDEHGRPIAYWIRKKHPGDTLDWSVEYERVPANRVIHLFESLFAGQTRGIPPAAHVLDLCKELDEYAVAKLISAQIAACYSVFITTPTDPHLLATLMQTGRPMSDLTSNERIQDFSPGRAQYLNVGEKVEFANPPNGGSGYIEFTEERKRAIAAGLSFPYEVLAKDYTKCNYSVGRLSLIDGRQTFRAKQALFKAKVCRRVWRQFLVECVLFEIVAIDPAAFEANQTAYCGHTWIAPGWAWVQPEVEIQSATEAVRNNLSTLADELAAQGRDLDETLRQRAREVKKCRKYELPDLTDPAPGQGGAAGQNQKDANKQDQQDSATPADKSKPKDTAKPKSGVFDPALSGEVAVGI